MVLGLNRRDKGDEMPYLPLALLVRSFLFSSIPFSYVSFRVEEIFYFLCFHVKMKCYCEIPS